MAEALDNYSDLELSDEEHDSLDGQFSRAANHLKSLISKLESKKLLQLYSYYKQGTEGRCTTDRPRWFDAQGKMKWDAWHSLGDMPSHAAKEKYVSMIRELDPSFKSTGREGSGKTESSWAAVSTLGGDEEEVDEADKTIFDLSREGRAECVAALLVKHPEAGTVCDDDGLYAIHWAADRGHSAVIRTLIASCGKGVVEQMDGSGQTALHYAAGCGHTEAVRVLLAAGACGNARDHEGDTPLAVATDPDVMSLLS